MPGLADVLRDVDSVFHPEIVATSSYSALQIFAEWAHRGLAMIAGLLFLGTALGAWFCYRDSLFVRLVSFFASAVLAFFPTAAESGLYTEREFRGVL